MQLFTKQFGRQVQFSPITEHNIEHCGGSVKSAREGGGSTSLCSVSDLRKTSGISISIPSRCALYSSTT